MNFTVLGASGFVGRNLAMRLKEYGHSVSTPARSENNSYIGALKDYPLGNVIYCIGLTADFRKKPFETLDAHACLLGKILQTCEFDALTYLSSTRVYRRTEMTGETSRISVSPGDSDDLYNISKLMGESICLNSGRKCRVARLSNVYGVEIGSENFLASVLEAAATKKKVRLRTAENSEKDYVSINDVTHWLEKISSQGRHTIYNLARGRNTSHESLMATMRKTGIKVTCAPHANAIIQPQIDISRITREFGPPRYSIEEEFPRLLDAYRVALES